MQRCRPLGAPIRKAGDRRRTVVGQLRACGKNWQQVLAILSDLPPADLHVGIFSAAATTLRKTARWEEAVQLLMQMPEAKVKPDVVNFNATISACSSAGQWPAASILLELMKQQEVTPDVISYNSLLSACDRAAETPEALSCMARMRSASITPDQTSFSTLMSAVSRSGEWQLVIHLLSDMHQLKVPKDPVCYSVTMGACEKASEWLLALDLFEAMHQQRLHRDVVSYGNAMCAMSKAGSWQGALHLICQMQREAIELDTVVCNSCLGACANAARWQEALDLLREMTHQKLKKTTVTCNSVVRALEGGGEHRRAVAVLLHDFIDEEVEECGRPSMFRTARPTQITPQLRASIAERLERALDFGRFEAVESSADASAMNEGSICGAVRPVVAMVSKESFAKLQPSPTWSSKEAEQALEAFLDPADSHLREEALLFAAELKNSLPAAYADAEVVPYGSIISGFAAHDADADFSLLAGDTPSRHLQQRILIEWRTRLLNDGYEVSAIGLGGRIPVLTLHWGPEGSRTADVTIGNRLGIYKSQLLREYSLLDRRLCDLVLAVKRWASLRGISGQTRGYPGGYAWSLMAIAFAQCCTPLVPSLQASAEPKIWEEDGQCYNVAWLPAAQVSANCLDSPWTSAALLHGFFDFFSERFDFAVDSASVRLGRRAVKVSTSRLVTEIGPQRLSLEDPIETDWDLGHILSRQRLQRVLAELRRASRQMDPGCKAADEELLAARLAAVFRARGKKLPR